VTSLLAPEQVSDTRAQWLLAGLLAGWSPADQSMRAPALSAVPQLDDMAPLWRMMQTVGSTVPQQTMSMLPPSAPAAGSRQQASAPAERLDRLAALLVSAISEGPPVQAAAALLAAGGYMQGLRAASSRNATLAVLMCIAACVPLACSAAVIAQQVAMGRPAHQVQAAALMRDAASLAAVVASQVLPVPCDFQWGASRVQCRLGVFGDASATSRVPHTTNCLCRQGPMSHGHRLLLRSCTARRQRCWKLSATCRTCTHQQQKGILRSRQLQYCMSERLAYLCSILAPSVRLLPDLVLLSVVCFARFVGFLWTWIGFRQV
jgi:hypothetical protein